MKKLARVLKALGDSNRLNIVMTIGRESRPVTEITNAIGLSQTLVSFHLRVLRDAEIVTAKRTGPFIYYSLSNSVFLDVIGALSNMINYRGVLSEETPGQKI